MKRINTKSTLLTVICIVSLYCFVSVNTTAPNYTAMPTINRGVEVTEINESKMPDLMFIESIVKVLSKFTTAK